MSRSSLALGTLATALALSGCSIEPQELEQDFSWEVSVANMRDAQLGNCQFGGTIYTVGGRVNRASVYRWTGRRWVGEALLVGGDRLWSCWIGHGGLAFAVGQEQTILKKSPEGWSRSELPDGLEGADLFGVTGFADGTAVAVGGGLAGATQQAVILHYDGSSWTRADARHIRTRNLRAVWGTAPDDIWAVGDRGAIAHFDGEEWKPVPSRVDVPLHAVVGSSRTEAYAIGGSSTGVVLRWNGSSWVDFDTMPFALYSGWTSPSGDLFVGGDQGFVARYVRRQGVHDRPALVGPPLEGLRIESILELGSALLGAAATVEVADDGDWRGAVVAHGRSFSGPLVENRVPDAGIPEPDAGDEADAALIDADLPDATPSE